MNDRFEDPREQAAYDEGLAEVERLREDRDNRLDQFRRADREADILRAEVERLREDLCKAIKLARDFNRGAMTWQEYDRKLAALEVANGNR